jgi:hypothetical protein
MPTAATRAVMRKMVEAGNEKEATTKWRETHGQHCFAHNCASGGCERGRGCCFLHAELDTGNGGGGLVKQEDPTWLEENQEE